jgi:hypothetical protein
VTHRFVIPTRQKVGVLFSSKAQIKAGQNYKPNQPSEVKGYAAILIFAVADQPFGITVTEAASADGTFVTTQTFTAVANGGSYVVLQRFAPIGAYLNVDVHVPGAVDTKTFEILVQGLPIS